MASLSRRNGHRELNAWPGWVDALSSLVMVVIFLLMVFVVAQFYLATALTGRDEQLQVVTRKVAELNDLLALEREANADLRVNIAQMSDQLQASVATREDLSASLGKLKDERDVSAREAASLAADIKALRELRQRLEGEMAERTAALRLSDQERQALLSQLGSARDRSKELEAKLAEAGEKTMLAQKDIALRNEQIDTLNNQIAALRDQLARIGEALNLSEKKAAEQQVQIADLGTRLNQALASKVQELARYRSEFFGRMREALANRQDIRIVGDRFVFQSDILFPSGSAELQEAGKKRMADLAHTLMELGKTIPTDINWVLRVDGHTDVRPITRSFASNWELSSARAVTVLRYLHENRQVPAQNMSAVAYGHERPLVDPDKPGSQALNKRVDIVVLSTASDDVRRLFSDVLRDNEKL